MDKKLLLCIKENNALQLEKILKETINTKYKTKESIMKGCIVRAIEYEHLDCIEELLRLGYPLNKKDQYGYTILADAIFAKKLKSIKCLIKEGADLSSENIYDATIVVQFLSREDMSVVYTEKEMCDVLDMLNVNIKINKKNKYGKNAIIYAIENNYYECVCWLLKNGAQVKTEFDGACREYNLISYALERNNINEPIAKKLIEYGADIHYSDMPLRIIKDVHMFPSEKKLAMSILINSCCDTLSVYFDEIIKIAQKMGNQEMVAMIKEEPHKRLLEEVMNIVPFPVDGGHIKFHIDLCCYASKNSYRVVKEQEKLRRKAQQKEYYQKKYNL